MDHYVSVMNNKRSWGKGYIMYNVFLKGNDDIQLSAMENGSLAP